MKRLKELRKEKDWTQKRVAELLGTKDITVSRYEKGEREPDFNTLCKLASIFEVSVDYLLGISDTKKAPQESNPAELLRNYLEKKIGRAPTEEELRRIDKAADLFIESYDK